MTRNQTTEVSIPTYDGGNWSIVITTETTWCPWWSGIFFAYIKRNDYYYYINGSNDFFSDFKIKDTFSSFYIHTI